MRKPSIPSQVSPASRAERRRRGMARLSCPCCAPLDPERPRASVRLANWLARAASHAATRDGIEPAHGATTTASSFEDLSK